MIQNQLARFLAWAAPHRHLIAGISVLSAVVTGGGYFFLTLSHGGMAVRSSAIALTLILEATYLVADEDGRDARKAKEWTPAWMLTNALVGIGIGVSVCVLTVIALSSTPDRSHPTQSSEVIAYMTPVLLVMISGWFLKKIWSAIHRADTGDTPAPLRGSQRLYPSRRIVDIQLEFGYIYAGMAVLGFGAGAVLAHRLGIWYAAALVAEALVVTACVTGIVLWTRLGDVRRDVARLLLRQAFFTFLLCFALLAATLDSTAAAAPSQVSIAASIMLLPSLLETASSLRQAGLLRTGLLSEAVNDLRTAADRHRAQVRNVTRPAGS